MAGRLTRGSRIEQALHAMELRRRGRPRTLTEQTALSWLEARLGLDRPLEEYAPSTRDRYIRGFLRGKSGAELRAEQRTQRREHTEQVYGVTPSQLTRINKLREELAVYHLDVAPYHDWETLSDIARIYSARYVLKVLRNQLDSVKHFTHDRDPIPGRKRWDSRGQLESEFLQDSIERTSASFAAGMKGTDPYYYYHGRL